MWANTKALLRKAGLVCSLTTESTTHCSFESAFIFEGTSKLNICNIFVGSLVFTAQFILNGNVIPLSFYDVQNQFSKLMLSGKTFVQSYFLCNLP